MADRDDSAAESSTESVRFEVRVPREMWPQPQSLAHVLEAEASVRRRAREKGFITRWPSTETVGIASCKAMACNARLLEIVAEWFCPTQHVPTYVPIELLRREAGIDV